MISGLDTLRTVSEIFFMFGEYQTPEWDNFYSCQNMESMNYGQWSYLYKIFWTLVVRICPNIACRIPDSTCNIRTYSDDQCPKYLVGNGQLSFLEMIRYSYPMSRYCTDMTTIHISSPDTGWNQSEIFFMFGEYQTPEWDNFYSCQNMESISSQILHAIFGHIRTTSVQNISSEMDSCHFWR